MQLRGLVSEENNPALQTLPQAAHDRIVPSDESLNVSSTTSFSDSSNNCWPAYGEVASDLPPGITSHETPTILPSSNFVAPAYDYATVFAKSHVPPERDISEAWWDALKDPSTMPDWLQFPLPPYTDMTEGGLYSPANTF